MTQATYYLTNHPNSPERRKNFWGQKKPREWLAEVEKVTVPVQKLPEDESVLWSKAKIKWKKTGITYNGILSVVRASGVSYHAITDSCKKSGEFVLVSYMTVSKRSTKGQPVMDVKTGVKYETKSHAARALGVARTAVDAMVLEGRMELV